MIAAVLLLIGLLSVPVLVLLTRAEDAASWRRSLLAFRLTLSPGLTMADVTNWLVTVNSTTQADRWGPLPALLQAHPVALEERATAHGIEHYLLVPENMRNDIQPGLLANLPGVRLEEAPEHLARRPRFAIAAEAAVSSHRRPLNDVQAVTASRARLSSFPSLAGAEEVWVQWIFRGGGIPARVPSVSARGKSRDNWWSDDGVPADPEAVQAARLKQQAPLLRAVARVGVANTASVKRAYALFGPAWAPLRVINATGAGVVRRWWLPPFWAAGRLQRRAMPLLKRWPLTLNTDELAGLLGLVVGDVRLPGLALGGSRQVPPSPDMPTNGDVVVGLSDYPGMQDRSLSLRTLDRLLHTHIVGPTGTGKSTLVGNLALQDIAAGRCVILIDPKNDLVDAILERFPSSRADDLIVVDASDTSTPIGFNPLAGGSDEHERELAVDRVLHVFREIWADFWGPRTDDVLRSALLTLVQVRAPDGSPLTLCEAETLLTNAAFRRTLWRQSPPVRLRPFWAWYEQLKPNEQASVIGPVLNKLRSFTDRTALRLMLGQATGLDLSTVMNRRQVLLVNLAQGRLGEETAALIGSLFVAMLQEATLRRAYLQPSARQPVMVYIDEFQIVLRLGAVRELLDVGRGFGVGLNLAHQYLHQLPRDVAHAVLGTARNQVIFQVGQEDARALAKSVEPVMTAADLQALGTHHIVLRPCVGGRTAAPVTARTLPLPTPTRDGRVLAQASRERYGMSRLAVEAALQSRLRIAEPRFNFGRSPRGVPT